MKAKLKEYFPIIFLTIVVLMAVSVLAGIDSITSDKIADQEEQKINSMLSEMFTEMSEYILDEDTEIYTIKAGEETIGYAFLAIGKGYGGDINILVGLEDEETIKGITIISQEETPGLGTRIADSEFTDKFAGIAIDDIELTRDGTGIDALTRATISSSAVVDAVKTEALAKVAQLNGGE